MAEDVSQQESSALSVQLDMALDMLAANDGHILDLSRTGLGRDGVATIAEALRVNASVRVVKLDACGITHDCLGVLVDALGDRTDVQQLDLSHNHLGGQGASHLARLIVTTSCRYSCCVVTRLLYGGALRTSCGCCASCHAESVHVCVVWRSTTHAETPQHASW